MNDLISRSALLEELSKIKTIGQEHPAHFLWRFAFAVALKAVKKSPAVDAVEVVRCKDCIHYEKNMLYSECWHKIGMINVYDDCYCSRGERRAE